MALVTLGQMVQMFIMMAIGWLLFKRKIFNGDMMLASDSKVLEGHNWKQYRTELAEKAKAEKGDKAKNDDAYYFFKKDQGVLPEVEIRTVLTCHARSGVCSKCYGMLSAVSAARRSFELSVAKNRTPLGFAAVRLISSVSGLFMQFMTTSNESSKSGMASV